MTRREPSLTDPGPLAKNFDDLASLVYALRTHVQIHTERLNNGALTFDELRQEVGTMRPKPRPINWLGIAAFAVSVLGLAFVAGTYPDRAELGDIQDRIDARAAQAEEAQRVMEKEQVRTRIVIEGLQATVLDLTQQVRAAGRPKKGR